MSGRREERATRVEWNPRLEGFDCLACGRRVRPDDVVSEPFCSACHQPLVARYRAEPSQGERETLEGNDVWRWRPFLPFSDRPEPVRLGEGGTPLVPVPDLARSLGVRELWLKDESPNPTQSFKARGLALAVHGARAFGIEAITLPSAGNAGSAAAAYAAAAGLRCRITVPDDTPEPFVIEQQALGAEVRKVRGTIADAGRALGEWAPAPAWWNVATFREPFRLEGKKTLGFEIAEQLGWRLPEAIFYPTGGGTGLVGMWRAFGELRERGWVSDAMPRLVSVQAEGCAPIVRALERGAERAEPWKDASTLALGLRVPSPFADALMLRSIRETAGTAVAVGEDAMLDAMVRLTRGTGRLACPEGGAALAGLQMLRERGDVGENDRVVVLNTGSGLKYPEAWRSALRRIASVAAWAGVALAAFAGLAGASARSRVAHPTSSHAGQSRHETSAPEEPAAEPEEVAASNAGSVLLVRLDGIVSPVMAEALDAAIHRAERGRHSALVIELDTPGGLETSMRDMVKQMLSSEVPVLVWIGPSGARAASAGVFITMAADIAAMAPGTNIGAATPVNLQGGMDSTMSRKATNDAAAFARSVARQRGRNAEWAERAVRQAVAASDSEAVQLHIVDFMASSVPELLERADGRSWRRGNENHTLAVAHREIERIQPGVRQRILGTLADPNIAYILMLVGFYGVLFELQNPGAILPGVVGGIALILAFFALSTLPVNTAGIALIVLAIAFFVAEIKVTSHGLLAAGGVLSLLLGSLFLFHGDQIRVSWGVMGGATIVTALFFLVVVNAGLRAQRLRVQSGAAGMRGTRGVVIERIAPTGRVRIGDTLWNARSAASIDVGTNVEVIGLEGLTVEVRPSAKEA